MPASAFRRSLVPPSYRSDGRRSSPVRGTGQAWRVAGGAILVLIAFASVTVAQVRPAPTPAPRPAPGPTPGAGTWEIGGGIAWVAGYDFGDRAAELTRNVTTGGGRTVLFNSSSETLAAAGFLGRVGVFLSRSLLVEGGLRYGRPIYAVALTGDTESAPSITAEMEVTQYVVDGAAVWHFNGASFNRGRGVPFVSGGVGYLRELLEGNELVETGREYRAGAGIKYWFGGARRRFGLRGEGGVSIRDGGFDFEDKLRPVPTASASLVYIF